MQVEIKMDAAQKEPKIVIIAAELTDEINDLARRLLEPRLITGFRGDMLELIEPNSIVRVYAAAGKVYAATEKGEYLLKARLYELEGRLGSGFVRISNSEIVNLKKARGFDLSLAGTICVSLTDGTAAYVSRRYVAQIKQVLGI